MIDNDKKEIEALRKALQPPRVSFTLATFLGLLDFVVFLIKWTLIGYCLHKGWDLNV